MGSYKFDDKDWFNDSVLVDFISTPLKEQETHQYTVNKPRSVIEKKLDRFFRKDS